jgi:hypothetical protein
MGLNINQNAVFQTLDSNEIATISKARGISVLVYNNASFATIETISENGVVLSSLDLPASQSLEITADGGNLLQTIRVTSSGGTTYVVSLGGQIVVS